MVTVRPTTECISELELTRLMARDITHAILTSFEGWTAPRHDNAVPSNHLQNGTSHRLASKRGGLVPTRALASQSMPTSEGSPAPPRAIRQI